MNRKLDLNAIQRPTFELTLMDENRTTVHVKTPSVNKFREMLAVATEIEKVDASSEETVELIYSFLAGVLSCNREVLTITPKELLEKYNVDLDAALLIYREYIGFLNDITAEKN